MQLLNNAYYDARVHRAYKAIRVKEPYAEAIRDGEQKIIVLPSFSPYRGDVVIIEQGTGVDGTGETSLKKGGLQAICIVEVYDVRKVDDLDDEQKMLTGYPSSAWDKMYGYGYIVRNPRPLIEWPILKAGMNLFTLIMDKDDLNEYPQITIEREFELAQEYFPERVQELLRPRWKRVLLKLWPWVIGLILGYVVGGFIL
jgi:hypothetical protein